MKLVDLVNFRNTLVHGVDLGPLKQELDKIIKHYSDSINTVDLDFAKSSNTAIDSFRSIKDSLSTPQDSINETIVSLNKEIVRRTQRFFTESYTVERELTGVPELLTQNLRTLRHWRNIKLELSDSPDLHMLGVIQKNVNHRYPVLEIGCRDGEWTKYLVAGDPLYVAEYTDEFLHNAVHQFTRQYVPRVRQYKIIKNTIENLPENQFGFIFSYNFFNYLSFDSIKQWMKSAHTWLKPGGVIMFTYNNADFGYGAGMAESSVQSYCPMSLLRPMCESIGLEYHDHQDYVDTLFTPMSWIQFKKPGELSTVKLAQALGQIKYYADS
jgi:SAM-dependent methyltransferase